ncbi:MAG: glutathione S-transferase N-terminal domain-containing protein, partial [Stellaceae bacterium]
MLKLHGYFRSSAAFRVRIALNLKRLSYEQAFVHLRKNEQGAPGYLAKNPQGLVPLLENGDTRFIQSLAIIEYLDEIHPSPKFLPEGPEDRARVRALAQIIAADIHPLDNLRVLRYLAKPLGHD